MTNIPARVALTQHPAQKKFTARQKAFRLYLWLIAALPLLVLIVALGAMGTGDYRNPFAPLRSFRVGR
jgi:hypothetical protein